MNLDSRIASVASLSQGTINILVRYNATGFRACFSASDSGDPSSEIIIVQIGDTMRFQVRESGTTLFLFQTSVNPRDNQWHMFTWTVKSGVGNVIYLDGLPAAGSYLFGNSASTFFFNDVNDLDSFKIGANVDSGGLQFIWAGFINNFAIWSISLTADEVAQLWIFRAKYLFQQTQLLSLVDGWPMERGDDATSAAGDTFRGIQNGNDGIGVGSVFWAAEDFFSYLLAAPWVALLEVSANPIPVFYHHYQQMRNC